MKFLNKIFSHRQKETYPSIRIYQHDDTLSTQDIANIKKIILKHYHGPSSKSTVLNMLQQLLSVDCNCISFEHNMDLNLIAVYYQCGWSTARYWVWTPKALTFLWEVSALFYIWYRWWDSLSAASQNSPLDYFPSFRDSLNCHKTSVRSFSSPTILVNQKNSLTTVFSWYRWQDTFFILNTESINISILLKINTCFSTVIVQ